MVRFADAARLKLEGLPPNVDQHSPLAEQVHFIYLAMHQYARRNNWEEFRRQGTDGRKGQFTMRYLVEQLFPEASREERQAIQQIASSVLRQTGAAVCIHNPSPSELATGTKPTWYVADAMPDNLMVVATHHKPGPTPGPPDRLTQVANKLTPHEAGEDRVPAPVELSHRPEPATAAERDMVVNDRFIQDIFEQIATCPVPITIPELGVITGQQQWAVRHATEKLLAEDKLVWRTETRTEKAVRGGGELPPARPSRLFWPAPGPVPERTKLPPGIDPVKSSREHAAERLRQHAEDDLRVYEHLKPGERHRTSGKIAGALGMSIERVKASLARLLESGRLRRHETSHQYFWADVPPRLQKKKTDPADEPAPERMPQSVRPAATDEPEEDTLVERIYGLLDELAREAGYEIEVDDGSSDELAERITFLERENADLRRQLEKIKSVLG